MAIDKITTPAIADDAVTNAKVSYNNNQFRNIIINGDMSIAQRGTSVTGKVQGGYFTIDRFPFLTVTGSNAEFTLSQDTDAPTGQGFVKSYKVDCTTAHTVTGSNQIAIRQFVEGQNLQYLKKGTANAESLTLSFWVKSNKTGTYIAELYDLDNTRQISKSYTIDSASTWEKKTLTFAGDTTGAFDNDNGGSLMLHLWLAAGSDFTSGTLSTSWSSATSADRAVGQVNLADNTANNFWITGVQLEAGTSASDFEFLPHDVNLQRCERYYWKWTPDDAYDSVSACGSFGTGGVNLGFAFPNKMRAEPSISAPTDGKLHVRMGTTTASVTSITNRSSSTNLGIEAGTGTIGNGDGGVFRDSGGNNSYVIADAEL